MSRRRQCGGASLGGVAVWIGRADQLTFHSYLFVKSVPFSVRKAVNVRNGLRYAKEGRLVLNAFSVNWNLKQRLPYLLSYVSEVGG